MSPPAAVNWSQSLDRVEEKRNLREAVIEATCLYPVVANATSGHFGSPRFVKQVQVPDAV